MKKMLFREIFLLCDYICDYILIKQKCLLISISGYAYQCRRDTYCNKLHLHYL